MRDINRIWLCFHGQHEVNGRKFTSLKKPFPLLLILLFHYGKVDVFQKKNIHFN